MRKKKTLWEKIDDAYWCCWRFVRDIVAPVWYRFVGYKHHIIKTKLKPSAWYDADSRILYGVMAVVEWFVENDMRRFTQEAFERELVRIKRNEPEEYHEDHIAGWVDQYEYDQNIIAVYDWWKNYPARCKEVDNSLTVWNDYVESLIDKSEHCASFIGFMNKRNRMTKEEEAEEKKLLNIHTDLEEKLQEEEQTFLKKAIEFRGGMWS